MDKKVKSCFQFEIVFIQITTLFQLRITSSGVRYYMHYDVYKHFLYVSLPNEKLVIRMQPEKESNLSAQRTENISSEKYEIVAGIIGKTCIGNKKCGDGGLAVDATLAYPKVIT